MKEENFRKSSKVDKEQQSDFESTPKFREAVVRKLHDLLKTSPNAETAPEIAVRSRLAKLQALTEFLTDGKDSVAKEQQQETLEKAERRIR